MKKIRILALVHDHLVPPDDTTGIDVTEAEWKMEYDVIETLREIGHDVRVLGIHDDLSGIRQAAEEFKPLIAEKPRDAKVRLARHVVEWLHDRNAADAAETEFVRVTHGELPDNIPTHHVGRGPDRGPRGRSG